MRPCTMEATLEVVVLAEQWGVTPAELSIAWAIARPCNASVIIGTTTVGYNAPSPRVDSS